MFGAWNFLSIKKRGLKGQNVDFDLVNESTTKKVVLNNKPIGCLYETLDLPAGMRSNMPLVASTGTTLRMND
jgi:hypothetical protein